MRIPSIKDKKTRKYVKIAAVVLGMAALAWGGTYLLTRRAASRAEELLRKGFGAVAADTVDCHRYRLTGSAANCKILIAAYFQSRRVERLEWASQACLEAGHEIPEDYIGLAATREWTGRAQEALQILSEGASKFDKIPDVYYTLAQFFQRNKQDDAAVNAFKQALARAPQDNALAIEALQFFANAKKWSDGKQIAEQLKTVQTDNPEVKVFLARFLIKNGNKAGAKELLDQANELVKAKPEVRKQLEDRYPDVYAEIKA
jgi:tetratricopeptide (TPR) repeat protein